MPFSKIGNKFLNENSLNKPKIEIKNKLKFIIKNIVDVLNKDDKSFDK